MENKRNKLIEVLKGKYECKFTDGDYVAPNELSEMISKTESPKREKRKRVKVAPVAVYSTTSRDKGFDDND
jgi:hypothetical protein